MMFRFTYDTESFETTFRLPQGSLYAQDCIIELVLMNDISPKWIYSEGKACAVGLLHQSRMVVYIAESEYDEDFRAEVTEALKSKSEIWGFNWEYISTVIKTLSGQGFPMNELQPTKKRGWSRNKCYELLRSKGILSESKGVYDNYGGDIKKAVEDWQKWLDDGEQQHLMDISQHLLGNLIKDALIYQFRNWLVKQIPMETA
jgi:hypothetical protein